MTITQTDTLLRAKKLGKNSYEISRGKKLLARVETAGQSVIFTWGRCNEESAKDAIFMLNSAAQNEANQRREREAKQEENILHIIAHVPRPVLIPQVIVALAPDGSLQAELPSGNGTRRVIPLKDRGAVESLKRILQEQLEGNIAIGEDGDPTRHQVWHWESHSQFPDSRCIHCIKEGRIRASSKRASSRELIVKTQDAEIRRIKHGVSGKDKIVLVQSNKNAEDLGL